MSGNLISIYIADDYLLIREGIKKIIKSLPEARIVGETNGIEDIHTKISALSPDIIIMELMLCNKPFSEIFKEIKTQSPKTKILIVSDCICEFPVIASIKSGISGFLRKNVSEEELIKAIRNIFQGQDYFSAEITQVLAKSLFTPGVDFSIREFEILRYICKGRSNEQIADLLFISEKTVATHRKNIMRKAKVKKSSDLIIWALEKKIV